MSNTEDYLDSLLNSITQVKEDMTAKEEEQKERASSISGAERIGADEDYLLANGLSITNPFASIAKNRTKKYDDLEFLKEFEEELKTGDSDKFIRDFEMELDEEEAEDGDDISDDNLMDSIEGIVSAAKKKADIDMAEDLAKATSAASEEDFGISPEFENPASFDGEVDLSADFSAENPEGEAGDGAEVDFMSALQNAGFGGMDASDEPSLGDMQFGGEMLSEDADVDLSAFAEGDEDLADIANLMDADELGLQIDGAGDEIELNARLSMEGGEAEKEAPKGFKGFLAKLKTIIFGEDDEDDLAEAAAAADNPSDDLSAEQLEVLNSLEGGGDSGKKGKKEKPKKEKKEKPKKEKKVKPKKEKKPKEPAEPDNTPPLPLPMIIIPVLLCVSFLVLVFNGTEMISRSLAFSSAKNAMEDKDYVSAYSELSGKEITEKDEKIWMQAKILGAVQYKYNSYQKFMELEQYDTALDNLVCALARAEANKTNAEYYEIVPQLSELRLEIEEALSSQFGVSAEEALEISALRRRTEYTHRIYDFLERAGMYNK